MIRRILYLFFILISVNSYAQHQLAEINHFECVFSSDTLPEDLKLEIFEEPENVFWCVANMNLGNAPKNEKEFLWFISSFYNEDFLMSKLYSTHDSDLGIHIYHENIQIENLDSIKTYKAYFENEYGEIIAIGYCYSILEKFQK